MRVVLVGFCFCGDSVEMEEDQVPNKDSSQATGEHNECDVSPFTSYVGYVTHHDYMSFKSSLSRGQRVLFSELLQICISSLFKIVFKWMDILSLCADWKFADMAVVPL